jgi:hypothetical protein
MSAFSNAVRRSLTALNVLDAQNQLAVAVKSATVTLTDAQIKALPTTEIEIVPAVPGTYLQFLMGFWHLDNRAGAYSNVSSAVLVFRLKQGEDTHKNVSVVYLETNEGALAEADTIHVVTFPMLFDLISNQPQALYGNELAEGSIVLSAFNGEAGDFTGGHANNTLKATVVYIGLDL